MKFDIKIIKVSIFAGLLVWLSDAVLDYIFFSGGNFFDLLILSVPGSQLFLRFFIIIAFFLSGSVISAYSNKNKKLLEELQDYESGKLITTQKDDSWEFWKNTRGGFNYVSAAFEKITGYLVDDLKQNPDLIKRIIYPDDLEKVLKHFENEANNTLKTAELEFRIVSRNKEIKNIKHTCQPVYDNDSKFKGTRGTNKEIPVKILAQNKEANISISNVLKAIHPQLYIINTKNYTVENYSKTQEENRDEQKCYKLIHGVDEPCSNQHPCPLEMVKKSKKPEIVYHTHYDKYGNPRQIEVHADPMLDKDGNVEKIIEHTIDITEFKQTKDDLKVSDERFKVIFNNAPNAFFLHDLNGTFISSNKSAEDLTGYKKNELIGKNFLRLKLLNMNDAVKQAQLLAENALGNSAGPEEFIINKKEGGKVPVEITSFPIKIGGRTIVFASARNITERKEAGRKSKLLNLVIETSKEVIFMTDTNGTFTYINPEFTNKYGYTTEEVVGKETPLILNNNSASKEDYKKFWEALLNNNSSSGKFNDTNRSETLTNVEAASNSTQNDNVNISSSIEVLNNSNRYATQSKDGKLIDIEVSVEPVLNDNGDITGFLAIQRNLAKRELAEENLPISKVRFQDLYENSMLGIFRSTPEGKLISANYAALNLLGYSSLDETNNMNLAEGYCDPSSRKIFTKILNKEGTIHGFETKWKRPDGTIVDLRESARTITGEDGKVLYYEGVFEDFTEKKRAEEELIKSKEKAEELNRLKSIFLANMSHELRTPLIGITGFANMLIEELASKENKQMAEIILQSGERLSRTLDLILDLSMLESDKLKVNKDKINIVEAIEESIDSIRQAARKKGLEFNFSRNDEKIFCNLDKKLFARVFHYFLDNSIKFTHKGSVNVKVFSNGKATIQIADTGIGIPKDKLNMIFEPFRQASEGYSREYEGTGLGLTIAKKFVEELGGVVKVKSEEAKGTLLTIEFPEIK